MARCLLALGSNLGDREKNLSLATREVAELASCQLLARSRWHATQPIGGPSGQGEFLNGSLVVETRLSPTELSDALHNIERRLGRQRIVRWDARVIDIDLLLYDQLRLDSPALTIPHPRMSFRRFVLEPACEIAGSMVEPAIGWTLAQLLRHLNTAPRYVAISAASREATEWLAGEICRVLGSPRLEDRLPATTSANSAGAKGVELLAARLSSWLGIPELAARLSDNPPPTQSPVVSGIWFGVTPPGHVQPALVIAWDVPGDNQSASKFRENLNRPGHGPLLKITAAENSVVLSEAMAAIRAVWPCLSAAGGK